MAVLQKLRGPFHEPAKARICLFSISRRKIKAHVNLLFQGLQVPNYQSPCSLWNSIG
jgi:hypothetical protein